MMTVGVEEAEIVIRLPLDVLDVLDAVVKHHPELAGKWQVLDGYLLAEDTVTALLQEDAGGLTPVQRMFDAAVMKALECGSDGIEPCDDGGDDSHD